MLTALANAFFNGLIAWLSVRGVDQVPLWSVGHTSTLTDTLGTLFLLPRLTCVFCTGAVWRELRTGRLARIEDLSRRQPLLAALPKSRLRRGAAVGGFALAVVAAPLTAVLVAADLGELSSGQFIAYKVLFAVTLGAVVTPMIAVCAMADRVSAGKPLGEAA